MNVAERWKKQYCHNETWSNLHLHVGKMTNAKDVYDALVGIHMYGSTNLDHVDKIIGNKSWTHNTCNVCSDQSHAQMIVFDINGGEYEHNVCSACLRKSLDKLQGKLP